MRTRIRTLARGALLPLMALAISSGCYSADRQLRADIREWMKAPFPRDSAEYERKFDALLEQGVPRVVPAALREATNATSPEERTRLFGLVTSVFTGSEQPPGRVYRTCLAAVGDADRFRSFLAVAALVNWAQRYRLQEDSIARVATDFEALTRSFQPWTRAYGYTLLARLKDRKDHVAGLLARAANKDPSFAVRYAAVVALHVLKGPEPEVIKRCLGLFETIGNQGPPYVPPQTPRSRDVLVKRLAEILRSNQRQEVEGLCALTYPYEAHRVDLRVYAIEIAPTLDLRELIPAIKPLVKDPDPIVRQEAKFALEAFE